MAIGKDKIFSITESHAEEEIREREEIFSGDSKSSHGESAESKSKLFPKIDSETIDAISNALNSFPKENQKLKGKPEYFEPNSAYPIGLLAKKLKSNFPVAYLIVVLKQTPGFQLIRDPGKAAITHFRLTDAENITFAPKKVKRPEVAINQETKDKFPAERIKLIGEDLVRDYLGQIFSLWMLHIKYIKTTEKHWVIDELCRLGYLTELTGQGYQRRVFTITKPAEKP
jgi:hypothetical protein